jgi:hypothetical protein
MIVRYVSFRASYDDPIDPINPGHPATLKEGTKTC